MPLIICDKKIDSCLPCNDDPLLNISAEEPDQDRFISNFHYFGPYGPGPNGPRLGQTFLSAGCLAICFSAVSQDEADDCALRQAQECAWNTWRDPNGDPILFFGSHAQICTQTCPDGTTFSWLQAAGSVFGLTQAEANSLAFSLACKRAQANKICISTSQLSFCLDTENTIGLVANGGTAFVLNNINFGSTLIECPTENSANYNVGDVIPYIWTIVSGSLPTGLELNGCAGTISGTPTSAGSSTITIRATDAIGSYQQKQITINVIEIEPEDSLLDDATIGQTYLQNFSTNIGDQEQQTWTVIDGELPNGLELTTAGVLSGTPDGPVLGHIFTIQVIDADLDFTCTKEYMMNVEGACPEAGTASWSCPVNTAEKRIAIVESDPSYPTYINSINRVIIPTSDGTNIFSVVNFTPVTPIIERTIPAGIAGSNPTITGEQFYHEPTDQIIALVRTGVASPFDFTVCFYDPSDGSLNGSIVLGTATFGGTVGSNFCSINITGNVALSIVLNNSQSFADLFIINPTTRAVVTSREMPIPTTVPEDYSLCYACDLRQLIVALRNTPFIYKFDDEDLTLDATFDIVDNVDRLNYIDSTGKIWAYSSDVSPEFVDVVNATTGAVETQFNVGPGNVRGHPIYNLVLDSWVIGVADINGGADNGLWFYNVHTFAQTCQILRDWAPGDQDDEMGWMGYDSDNGTIYTHTTVGAFHLEQVTPT